MLGITFFNRVEELQRAFARLVKEQEGIEDLVSSEKMKLKREGRDSSGRSELIEKADTCGRIAEENRAMKTQCQELQKKVEFGKSINK